MLAANHQQNECLISSLLQLTVDCMCDIAGFGKKKMGHLFEVQSDRSPVPTDPIWPVPGAVSLVVESEKKDLAPQVNRKLPLLESQSLLTKERIKAP